jgi:hypothetical protein
MLIRLILPFFLLTPLLSKADQGIPGDTTHSPKKAALYSAILPGLGQGYNRKYWKIPIVYAAIGTSVYFIYDNNKNYHRYRDEYLYRLNNGVPNDTELELYSDDQIRTLIDQYRRWRDISWIATGAFYALNIVDATVDAYLWRFDTGPDLSIRFRPTLFSTTGISPGFRFSFKF